MKKIYFTLFAALLFALINVNAQQHGTDTSSHHCSVGYAMGNAISDGRPIIWRNYDWDVPPHTTGLECNSTSTPDLDLPSWGPLKWVGTSQEYQYVFGGINETGLGCFNTLLIDFANENNYQMGNYRPQAWILANCSTVAQVRASIQKQIDFNNNVAGGVDYGWNWPAGAAGPAGDYAPALSLVVIDALGYTTLFEVAMNFYYEYDPTNASRLTQFPTQVGARANKPHRHTDFKDNTGTNYTTTGGRRYYEARDHLTAMATNADKLTIQEVMDTVSRWGDPDYDGSYTDGTNGCKNNNYMTQDATIIWGAAPSEDPRTATLFVALGNPDYSCFLPVWAVNGNSLSNRLTSTTTMGSAIAEQAKLLYGKRLDKNYDDYVNTFYRGMESNFREVVTLARTYWNANGFNAAMADAISDEAAETVYQTMLTMNKKSGLNLNPTPQLTAINVTTNGLAATVSATASDNGSITSTSWDFGDGGTSTLATATHTYSTAGTYLVRCRVQDNDGSRNSKWTFVTVPGITTGITNLNAAENISVYPNPSNGHITIDATKFSKGTMHMVIYDIIGNKIAEDHFQSASKHEVELLNQPAGIYFIRIEDNEGNVCFRKISLN